MKIGEKTMKDTKRLMLMALIVAIGTFTSQYSWFSVGVAKVTPVQHTINVVSAVMFGPWGAVGIAFSISLLRNILGTGSLLAFFGSMLGAFLSGYFYKLTNKDWAALLGEIIGTGILGAVLSYPVAKYILKSQGAAFMFVVPFSLSSGLGAIVGYQILAVLKIHMKKFNNKI